VDVRKHGEKWDSGGSLFKKKKDRVEDLNKGETDLFFLYAVDGLCEEGKKEEREKKKKKEK